MEPLRADHIRRAREAVDRGDPVLGGALHGPADGAVLLFVGESPEVASRFAESDPYVTNGLVADWRVREWTTVVGKDAQIPIDGSGALQSFAERLKRMTEFLRSREPKQ